MSHQYATIEDTVYFYFAANDTSGSGGDGATPLYDVREAGAAAGTIPLLSGTPTLLTHANYPAGCHEIAVAATTGNGFAADDTFAVFCTIAVDSQNPTGFVGSCTLTPLAKAAALTTVDTVVDAIKVVTDKFAFTVANQVDSNAIAISGDSTAADNLELQYDTTGLSGDTFPATQSQVSSLAATPGVGARPFVPTTITVTAGTNASGSADDLANDDSAVYTVDDATGTITLDFDYQLDPDTEVIQFLLVAAAQGNTDDIDFQVYDQVGAAYVTFETILGSNSLIYVNLDKVIVQKYTSDTGLFQTRLTGTGLTSATLTVNKAVAYGVAASTGIKNGTTITLTESAANQNLIGNNWILELEAQNLNDMYAEGGAVSGEGIVTAGHAHFNHMEVGSVNVGPSHFDTCGFGSTFIMRSAGDYEMINCHTDTPANGNITIDGNSLASATSLIIQDFKGSITFINLTSFHTMTVSGTELGNIILNGADATVKIRGIYESFTNNLTGSPTVTVEAVKASDIADTLTDTQDIQSRLPSALVGGLMDSNIGAIDGNTQLATRLKEFVDANVLFSDTAQAGGATTITLAAGTSVTDDDLHDFAIYINGGLGAGQFARINGVVASTQVATIVTPINGWETTPDATSTYIILSMGAIIHVTEMHADAINADSLTTDAITKIQAGVATETKQDIINTNVDSILVDTGTTLPTTLAAQDVVLAELNSGIIYSSAATGTLTTTVATTNLTGYADDQLIGRVIVVLSGNAEGEATDITDSANSGGTLTFTALTTAMANTDTFKIV